MQRLAIDYGRARVGIAIGSHVAREHGTIPADHELVEQLAHIIDQEEVSEIIIGRPIRSLGESGALDPELQVLRQQLIRRCPEIVVHFIDEAFSTTQAEIELKQQGVQRDEIRRRVDQYAAKIILDQYNAEHVKGDA